MTPLTCSSVSIANGNLLSDGRRNYSWDGENRLVGITYPGQSGKQIAFTYDGLGRRTAIASTPAGGGGAVATSYIWCGAHICQARNASNSPTREYYSEGEFVPGSPAQPYYYGPDQIGSLRRVFASTSSAPAYGYDPYGNALQSTAPLTDFGYAGMFYNADSRLYLTQYRTCDPIGEMSDPATNLYRYVNGNPISVNDPDGNGVAGAVIGGIIGGLIAAGGSEGAATFWGALEGAQIGSGLEDLLTELSCFLANESGAVGRNNPPVPELDPSGRVHGDIPDYVPERWTEEQQEDLVRDLQTSLRNRQLDQLRFGESPAHRERMRLEQNLLRQLLGKLGRYE
jgi:RHS repeat-associated protein